MCHCYHAFPPTPTRPLILSFLIAVICNHVTITVAGPNFLVILADDLGTGDIPFYWNSSIVDMPNIRRLSEMGITFTDAHSTPVCAPSRYMFLSGNYPHRGVEANGVWNFKVGCNQFRPHQKSIAAVLKERGGYHTAMVGKWHLGGNLPTKNGYVNYRVKLGEKRIWPEINETNILTDMNYDWTQPLQDGPQDIGFDYSYVTPQGIQRPPYAFFRDGYLTPELSDVVFWEEGKYHMPMGTSVIMRRRHGEGAKDWDSTAYNQILVNETVAFLDHHLDTRADDPFFIYVALGGIHTPYSPPNIYNANGESSQPVAEEYPNDYLSLLLEMDMVVGSLIDAIEKRQLANDTVIVFTSDNGGVSDKLSKTSQYNHTTSGPLRSHKGNIYEGGHRVPMIMRYDGEIPANETRSHLVSLSDIYATFMDMARIKKPRWSAQDSVSFAKYAINGENAKGLRKYLATFKFKQGFKAESLRKGNLKLIRNFEPTPEEPHIQLFDLEKDLSETTNIANLPEYKKVVNQMKRKLKKLGPCPNDIKKEFKLSKMRGKVVTCQWFQENVERCNWHHEGELKCNSICGRYYNNFEVCAKKTNINMTQPNDV